MKDDLSPYAEIVGGKVDGFQVGRAAAMLDSLHRKDKREFEELCRKLYARNWARKRRELDPEGVRQVHRDWRDRNREQVRKDARERARKKYRARAPLCTCAECGKKWKPAPCYAPVPGVTTRKAKFCSLKCSNKFHGREKSKRKNRGLRNMSLERSVVAVLSRAERELSAAEIFDLLAPGTKRGSLATKLTDWAKKGKLTRRFLRVAGERGGGHYLYAPVQETSARCQTGNQSEQRSGSTRAITRCSTAR